MNLAIIHPDLAPEYFDSFDSVNESSDPVEGEHHAIFDCLGKAYARELFPDLSRAISAQSAIFSISHNARGWPSFSLGLRSRVRTKPSLIGLCQAPNRLENDQSIKN